MKMDNSEKKNQNLAKQMLVAVLLYQMVEMKITDNSNQIQIGLMMLNISH